MAQPVFVKWRTGYGAKVKAEDAHAELERIRAENDGEVTRDDVKEAARPKASVLHKQVFDCPQKQASERYYSARAGEVIRNIVVVYEERPDVELPSHVTVREQNAAETSRRKVSVYKDTAEAMSDPEHREYVLAQALQQFAALRRRYAALSELAAVFAALDEVAASA